MKAAFTVQIPFPHGCVWLPDTHLTIDEWLTSLVETDEELDELNIKRIRFLQNHWPLEDLIEFGWNDSAGRQAIWSLSVGATAYILFFDGVDYQLIAAIEPRTNARLYGAVVGKLLQNSFFVSSRPASIRNYRPDLIPGIETDFVDTRFLFDQGATNADGAEWINSASALGKRNEGYLSKLFVGWVGKWIALPVVGYWHEDFPDS